MNLIEKLGQSKMENIYDALIDRTNWSEFFHEIFYPYYDIDKASFVWDICDNCFYFLMKIKCFPEIKFVINNDLIRPFLSTSLRDNDQYDKRILQNLNQFLKMRIIDYIFEVDEFEECEHINSDFVKECIEQREVKNESK